MLSSFDSLILNLMHYTFIPYLETLPWNLTLVFYYSCYFTLLDTLFYTYTGYLNWIRYLDRFSSYIDLTPFIDLDLLPWPVTLTCYVTKPDPSSDITLPIMLYNRLIGQIVSLRCQIFPVSKRHKGIRKGSKNSNISEVYLKYMYMQGRVVG